MGQKTHKVWRSSKSGNCIIKPREWEPPTISGVTYTVKFGPASLSECKSALGSLCVKNTNGHYHCNS
jgi:hypothetical protein